MDGFNYDTHNLILYNPFNHADVAEFDEDN